MFGKNKNTSNLIQPQFVPENPGVRNEFVSSTNAHLSEAQRLEKARDYLNTFQKRLIGNTATSNIFFTQLDASNNKIFDLSSLVSNDNQPILLGVFSQRSVEYNPKTFKDSTQTTSILRTLYNSNYSFKKEAGFDSTYIGWPYVYGSVKPSQPVEGQAVDKQAEMINSFCGPLLLWKVKINLDQVTGLQSIELVTDEDGKPIVNMNNEIIVRSLVQHNIRLQTQLNTKVVFDPNDIEGMCRNILTTYATSGLKIDANQLTNLVNIITNLQNQEFKSYQFEELRNQVGDNEFNIYNGGVLALFEPSTAGGSLYFDYSIMIQTDGPMFFDQLHNSICDTLKLSKEMGKSFSETELKEIIPLDYPQMKAVRMAINNSIVVQGPPGTGKSQTISNIIANFINLCRSGLFVTEKKTAANVVYNRLNRLRGYCLKFYEVDTDALEFTRQIRLGLNRIRELYGLSSINEAIAVSDVSSERLDEIFEKVDKFKQAMKNQQGKKFPEFVSKYIDNKDTLHSGLEYVKSLIQTFNTASDFWTFIKKTVDDSHFFTTIKGIQLSLKLTDDQMACLMDIATIYDGNPDTLAAAVPYYLKYGEVIPDADEMKNSVKARKFAKKPDYLALMNAIYKLDEFSIFTLSAKTKEWFQKFNVFATQEIYKNIITFANKFDAESFDFDLAHDLNKMITFLNQNASSILVDNESFFDEIDDLISQKESEDLIACESNFIRNLIQVLDTNPDLYRQFNELFAFINSVEVVKNIKLILNKYNGIISLCFPIIISSPHAASMLLPAKWGLFDHILIDEASQLSIEKALPILYRGKKFCILGDKKQTPPTDILDNIKFDFDPAKMKTIDDKLEWELLNEAKSLIEYALQKVQVTTLDYHYRSNKKELITFSNAVFYNGTLNVCDAPYRKVPGIKLINIANATNENGVNKQEAQVILEEVAKITKMPNHGSIGVITTTKEQADYILALFHSNGDQNVLNELYKSDPATGQDISLFVKTIEDVQGEERDNIFISCVWTTDADHTKLTSGFGYIEERYGSNRVNVAASRSKDMMYVVKSFNAANIESDNYNVLIFRKFLQYVELFAKVQDVNNTQISNMFTEYTRDVIANLDADISAKGESWLSKSIGEQLEPLIPEGFKCIYDYHEGNYKIGIVIKKLDDESYPIGIITDDFAFDPTIPDKERDYFQRKFLTIRGWKFIRVSALQWCRKANQEVIVMNILKFLKYILDTSTPEYKNNPMKHKIKLELDKLPATFSFFDQDKTDEEKMALKKLGIDVDDLNFDENVLEDNEEDDTAVSAAPSKTSASTPAEAPKSSTIDFSQYAKHVDHKPVPKTVEEDLAEKNEEVYSQPESAPVPVQAPTPPPVQVQKSIYTSPANPYSVTPSYYSAPSSIKPTPPPQPAVPQPYKPAPVQQITPVPVAPELDNYMNYTDYYSEPPKSYVTKKIGETSSKKKGGKG